MMLLWGGDRKTDDKVITEFTLICSQVYKLLFKHILFCEFQTLIIDSQCTEYGKRCLCTAAWRHT